MKVAGWGVWGLYHRGPMGLCRRQRMTQNLIREASKSGGSCDPRPSRAEMPVRRYWASPFHLFAFMAVSIEKPHHKVNQSNRHINKQVNSHRPQRCYRDQTHIYISAPQSICLFHLRIICQLISKWRKARKGSWEENINAIKITDLGSIGLGGRR